MEAKKVLGYLDIKRIGKFDNAKRWYPDDEIAEYFTNYRTPSRAFPFSYMRAAQTQKFARWLLANRPGVAKDLGLTAQEQKND